MIVKMCVWGFYHDAIIYIIQVLMRVENKYQSWIVHFSL